LCDVLYNTWQLGTSQNFFHRMLIVSSESTAIKIRVFWDVMLCRWR